MRQRTGAWVPRCQLTLLACWFVACHASPKPPTPTNELPSGYSYMPSEGPGMGAYLVQLIPPNHLRLVPSISDARSCDVELARGMDNTWTLQDVNSALTAPEVRDALTARRVYGDPTINPFRLMHGNEVLTVSQPCASEEGCANLPPQVHQAVVMFNHIYERRLIPECFPDGGTL